MNKKELSENYKLGYKIGFYFSLMLLRKHSDDESLIDKLIADYNNQPLIEKVKENVKEFLNAKIK